MDDLKDFLHKCSFDFVEAIPRRCPKCSSEFHSKTFAKHCPQCGALQHTEITEQLIQSQTEYPAIMLGDYFKTRLQEWCDHCETGKLSHTQSALHSNACWGCSFRYMNDYRHADYKEPPRGYIEAEIQS